MRRLFLGMLAFGLFELALLIKAGQLFGLFFPIAVVLLSMLAGGLVIRHYGLKTLGRLGEAVRTGVPPTSSPFSGLAGVLAGILLIVPGFLSDLLALLLLIPAARRIVASSLGWRLVSPGPAASRPYYHQPDTGGPTIEGEAVEIYGELSSKPIRRKASPWRQ